MKILSHVSFALTVSLAAVASSASAGTTLFFEDFENEPLGSIPSPFTLRFNGIQGVTDDTASGGSNSFKVIGSESAATGVSSNGLDYDYLTTLSWDFYVPEGANDGDLFGIMVYGGIGIYSFSSGSEQVEVRTIDASGNDVLHFSGLSSEAWHSVSISIDPTAQLFQVENSSATPSPLSFNPGTDPVRRRLGIVSGNQFGPNTYYVDNVQISTTVVPVPATLPLFAGGMLALGAIRSRRRNTSKQP